MIQIKEILSKVSPGISFDAEVDYVMDGVLDSVDIIEVTAALEKKFGVNIPGYMILPENFKNVSAIAKLVKDLGGTVEV